MSEEVAGLGDIVECYISDHHSFKFLVSTEGPVMMNRHGRGKIQNEKIMGKTKEEIKDICREYVERVDILKSPHKVSEWVLTDEPTDSQLC